MAASGTLATRKSSAAIIRGAGSSPMVTTACPSEQKLLPLIRSSPPAIAAAGSTVKMAGFSAVSCFAAIFEFPVEDEGAKLRSTSPPKSFAAESVIPDPFFNILLKKPEPDPYIQDNRSVNSSRQIVGHDAHSAGQLLKLAHRPGLPDIKQAKQGEPQSDCLPVQRGRNPERQPHPQNFVHNY